MTTIGTLTTQEGRTLELTDHDALWLSRAIVGESARDAWEVASCMLRRWAFVTDRSSRPPWPTLTDLVVGRFAHESFAGELQDRTGTVDVSGYSQPVSVQWRDRGDELSIRRRTVLRAKRWDEIPAAVRDAVLQLFNGAPLRVPGAVEFADGATSAAFMARNPGSRRVGAGTANTFISTPASRSYGDPTIVGSGASPPLPPPPAAAAGAVGGSPPPGDLVNDEVLNPPPPALLSLEGLASRLGALELRVRALELRVAGAAFGAVLLAELGRLALERFGS